MISHRILCLMKLPHWLLPKPLSCDLCGNSPVPHQSTFIFQSLSILLSRADYVLRDVRVYRRFIQLCEMLGEMLGRALLALGVFLRVVSYGADPTKARSYRSQVVWEEAVKRGIRMEQVVVGSFHTDMYRAYVGSRWHVFVSLPVPPHLSSVRIWADDKYLLKKHLRDAGVPVPDCRVAFRREEAKRVFAEIKKPLVVKPRFGSRGRHTTTGVHDEQVFIEAFLSARKLCAHVSIEEELFGQVCRGTVIGGVLRGFFEAHPPFVVGDGARSIAELIAEKNRERPERVSDIVLNDEVRHFLSRSAKSPTSVPQSGERVVLSHRTGRLFGGETRELLKTVHPKMVTILERAAHVIDIPIVGFDLIIENPEQDPDTQRWGIIEANTLPVIDLHYLPLHGELSRTAEAVWDLW